MIHKQRAGERKYQRDDRDKEISRAVEGGQR